MRRAIPALAATAWGIALVLRFHTSGIATSRTLAVESPHAPPQDAGTQPAAPAGVATTAPSSTATPRATRPGGSTTAGRSTSTTKHSTGRTSSAPSSASPTTTAAVAPTTTRTRSIDGPTVDSQYGPVQVRVTLQGTRLTDVTALQLPSDRARSRQISANAAPKLRQEALTAQSANIDTVSGASYTSEAYASSLQAALNAR